MFLGMLINGGDDILSHENDTGFQFDGEFDLSQQSDQHLPINESALFLPAIAPQTYQRGQNEVVPFHISYNDRESHDPEPVKKVRCVLCFRSGLTTIELERRRSQD